MTDTLNPLPSPEGVARGSVPTAFGITLDPATRWTDTGSALVGGSPLTVLRLTVAGSRLLDHLVGGGAVPPGAVANAFVRRLLDLGIAHPRPPAGGPAPDVTVVIPVRDDPGGLALTLGHLGPVAEVVVVDDCSIDPAAVRRAAATAPQADRTQVLRCSQAMGPGGARQMGWEAAATEVVAFVDADCRAGYGWLGPLLDHLADPAVGAVAPRIVARAGAGTPAWLAAYEALRSPLDLGSKPGAVRSRSPVPFVPSTALVVRRAALAEVGGFDPTLRHGEDVDLVWRLVAAGWTVRYEPASTVGHAVRRSFGALLRQRFDYGTSAAPLARHHTDSVAPIALSPWSGAAWVALVLGHPVAGVAVAGGSILALAPRLRSLGHPWREAAGMAVSGHLRSGRLIADAVRRTWWPLLLGACLVSARVRRFSLALAVVPPLLEHRPHREIVRLPAWVGVRLLDDLAYGLGVWVGAGRARSVTALRPHLTGRAPPPRHRAR